ncbi:Electron transport complex subunit RnfE [bioreactor metagenome]|uniref:Electron transport complex subunit RnfE n=1 Tax=bioreactor metagenome TaxID=1076179 RepID=A0A645FVB2_9ZZZZ
MLVSAVDGIGMGIGFTAALCAMGFIREFLGTGTITFSQQSIFPPIFTNPITIFILSPGGFFVFGMLIAFANKFAEKKGKEKAELHSCQGCPMFASCTSNKKECEL